MEKSMCREETRKRKNEKKIHEALKQQRDVFKKKTVGYLMSNTVSA